MMKKNRMMRLASGLLVAVLATTSMISGTYAKYVTSAESSDVARVAKWGVDVAVEGSELFLNEYEDGNETVVSCDIKEDVVAPGTKNDTGVRFTLKGTPEVDAGVAIAITAADGTAKIKEVFLKAGTYADLTTGNDKDDKFTFATDYYPVKFTLKNGAGKVLKEGKLSDISGYLTELSKVYDANTDLATIANDTDGEYVLTWAWEFSTVEKAETDKKDTLLGNMAADAKIKAKHVGDKFYLMAEGQEYCNDISFKVSITVTQVD